MASIAYESKFQQIIEDNIDLVSEYDSIDNNIPLEYCFEDIVAIYNTYKSINKLADFSYTVLSALKNAVLYKQNILDCMDMFITESTTEDPQNSIQQYFKEVGRIYEKNNNKFDIEFCPENRDKLIEMNLKTVISVAKRYQGLGLSLQELISAGNYGLITAFDKFDPSRSKLKDEVLENIEELPEEFTYAEVTERIKQFFTYGDIKKKFTDRFKPGVTYNKQELLKWIDKNIYNAKFNSIATMWIRAYILIELDNYSRLVKKPKTEIYKDKLENGSYCKELTLDIDSPVSDDSDTLLSDVLYVEDTTPTAFEINEAYKIFKDGLSKLLDGVKPRNRGIFLKKFGIGLPRPMLPKEIAEQEGLSKARVSQIFQSVIEQVQENSVKYNIDSDKLFEALRKIQ
jgi:RNA polymerase sigma factor (sigma-70 family)